MIYLYLHIPILFHLFIYHQINQLMLKFTPFQQQHLPHAYMYLQRADHHYQYVNN
jgi:hypothetical protein